MHLTDSVGFSFHISSGLSWSGPNKHSYIKTLSSTIHAIPWFGTIVSYFHHTSLCLCVQILFSSHSSWYFEKYRIKYLRYIFCTRSIPFIYVPFKVHELCTICHQSFWTIRHINYVNDYSILRFIITFISAVMWSLCLLSKNLIFFFNFVHSWVSTSSSLHTWRCSSCTPLMRPI